MSAPQITFYFDIGSPFSYIAFHVLKVGSMKPQDQFPLLTNSQNSPVFSECEIQYIPVSLRDIFQLCQNAPPLAVKSKFESHAST